VGVGDGLADPQQDVEDPRLRPALLAALRQVDDHVEALATDQGHGEKDVAFVASADFVQRHDAGAVELAGDPGLVEEALQQGPG
jgi:hypothetical protein